MKNSLLLLFLLLLSKSFAQIKLKVGDIAPELSITDYIKNTPEDKNFKNKYMLLEFWTTWCGPCLQEVPKLNLLQKRFKQNKKLLFVSITDEKPDKVERTLKRIPFSSIVVSDQKQETHKNYFAKSGDSFSYSYPSTLLIDHKGIIRWIGNPKLINEIMIQKLLDHQEIKETDVNPNNLNYGRLRATIGKPMTNRLYQEFSNDTITYSFVLLKNETKGPRMFLNFLKSNKTYFKTGSSLDTIVAELNDLYPERISIPEDLKKDTYSVLYKNVYLKSTEVGLLDIKTNLLKTLGLTETIIYKEEDTYVLRLVDKTKLEEIKDEKKVKNSFNGTHLLLGNTKIKSLTNAIGLNFKTVVKDETQLEGRYDFILRRDSEKNLIEDLNIYGLTLIKEKTNVPYYEYHKQ